LQREQFLFTDKKVSSINSTGNWRETTTELWSIQPDAVETIDGILGSLSNSCSGQIMHGLSLFWSKVENCCHLYECIAYMVILWNCPLKTSVYTQVHTRMSHAISPERIVEIRTVSDPDRPESLRTHHAQSNTVTPSNSESATGVKTTVTGRNESMKPHAIISTICWT
ncbi:hypothetical protein T10_13393, partial [Trichinella papuae]